MALLTPMSRGWKTNCSFNPHANGPFDGHVQNSRENLLSLLSLCPADLGVTNEDTVLPMISYHTSIHQQICKGETK